MFSTIRNYFSSNNKTVENLEKIVATYENDCKSFYERREKAEKAITKPEDTDVIKQLNINLLDVCKKYPNFYKNVNWFILIDDYLFMFKYTPHTATYLLNDRKIPLRITKRKTTREDTWTSIVDSLKLN
jgi:hypothetical protein